MSGHSKWSTIKRKKGENDAARGKIFTKIGREIAVCVKEGGADPGTNSRLKDLILKAKQNNVPNDNIDRVIKKAAGGTEKNDYEATVYEGYGPNGIAVIVECLTDNKNRTAADVRHAFDKFGGNMGTMGCVSFMFDRKGVIVIENDSLDEEKVMDDVMTAGADDFNFSEDAVEIYTEQASFVGVRDALEKMGYTFASAQIEQVPSTYTSLDDEESRIKMNRMLDTLQDNDDVQEVFHNWENSDEE
ncbi:MAG: YebC/PmpR family DNA-binding transcriptional regulator [Oscillospiraceae bacterium]